MKKLLGLLLIVLSLCLVTACSQPEDTTKSNSNNSSTGNEQKEETKTQEFSAGWWKFTAVNKEVTYLKYETVMKVLRAGSDIKEFKSNELDEYQGSDWYWNTLSVRCENYPEEKLVKIDSSQLPEWGKPKEEEKITASFTIPATTSLYTTNLDCNSSLIVDHKEDFPKIYYSGADNISASDEFKLEIVSNPNSISVVAAEITDKYFRCAAWLEGTVTVRIYDITKKTYSNVGTLVFTKKTSSQGGDNSKVSLLTGTWKVDQGYIGLFDTIEFYTDGTGKAYHSKYSNSGYNTFTWSINSDGTMRMINMLGQSNNTSFNVNATNLHINSFIGSCEIYATKQ